MEQLTASVYECTLAVEAHMICDLLSQAGISARIDGEYLSGVGGELPLGNTVRVRVDPARAAEAREVIAEWEKLQPPEPAAAPGAPPPKSRAVMWFLLGTLSGLAVAIFLSHAFRRVDPFGVDYNGDGRHDIVYHTRDGLPTLTEFDRNFDGTWDARWTFDYRGLEKHYEGDDDFNGRFEWQTEFTDAGKGRAELDLDGDGRPDQVWHYEFDVLSRIDYLQHEGGHASKRTFLKAGLPSSAEYDDDGDGVFERRVEYDARVEPRM